MFSLSLAATPFVGATSQIQRAIASLRARGSDAHLWLPGGDVRTYGPELVVNGGLDSDTDWEVGANWAVSGGKANATAANDFSMVQDIGSVAGQLYSVTFTISGIASGSIRVSVGSVYDTAYPLYSANGTYTVERIAKSSNTKIYMYPTGTFTGSIDNISVREITSITPTITSGLTTGNYLESTGNTLATVNNPVGLVLDALGTVGSELVTNGGFAANISGVSSDATYGGALSHDTTVFTDGGLKVVHTGSYSGAYVAVPTTIGKTYRFATEFDKGGASFTINLQVTNTTTYAGGSTNADADASANRGLLEVFVVATATTSYLHVNGDSSASRTFYVDNISVREVSGLHLTQTTTANKPVLRRGAYNLVKYSESLETTSGFWQATNCTKTDGVLDPDGGMTAHTLTATADGGSYLNAYAFGVKGCNGAWIRRRSGVGAVQGFNGGAYIPWPGLTTEWQRITIQNINTSTQYVMFKFATAGDSVDVWRPQGVDGSVLGDYSPTTTAAASNPTAGRYSWSFDGSNDTLGAAFASGALASNMDCFIVVKRNTAAQFLILNGTGFVAVVSGSASSAADTIPGGYTWVVDGAVVADTRGALHTALTVGVNHIFEARNLNLSSWTSVGVGGIGGFYLNGEIGEVILTTAMSDADRTLIRSYLASKHGVTL